jgi:ethanolamine utilization protein EutN
MFIGKVSGSVVSTQKIDTVVGSKLLLVKAMTVKGDSPGELADTGRVAVAIDVLGAGEGDLVLVTQGSSARLAPNLKDAPVDAVIIGIVDSVDVLGKQIFSARS